MNVKVIMQKLSSKHDCRSKHNKCFIVYVACCSTPKVDKKVQAKHKSSVIFSLEVESNGGFLLV